jgi:hypothetical protein
LLTAGDELGTMGGAELELPVFVAYVPGADGVTGSPCGVPVQRVGLAAGMENEVQALGMEKSGNVSEP